MCVTGFSVEITRCTLMCTLMYFDVSGWMTLREHESVERGGESMREHDLVERGRLDALLERA